MKYTIIIFLGIIIGVILFLGIIAFLIWQRVKKTAHKMGFTNINKISDITSEMDRLKEEDSHRARSVSGMTSLLLPHIIKDFPEFNENMIYNMTEESIRCIFESLSNLDKSKLDKVPLVKQNISDMIDNYEKNNIIVNYSDIIFHDFAIKEYDEKDGVATVTVSTSLEYYYHKKQDNDIKIDNTRYKKQTRLSCKFIYIYDESIINDSEKKVLGINCPNCGSAIKVLGHKYCEYCGTAVKEINLKSWAFSSYDEY